ncbi:unnamed protein product [Didymodactylos carnosus]|uniref:Uncharacterized protein n=1 Tax=Didymodactylos carnosus TaxID=1234261 RepID=A0A8S2G1B1_9BILA|nr:unnamed protein product [Didymodactylos carnosus]CAF4406382.1 unnamed protein product [Didymodactylos carnosus]
MKKYEKYREVQKQSQIQGTGEKYSRTPSASKHQKKQELHFANKSEQNLEIIGSSGQTDNRTILYKPLTVRLNPPLSADDVLDEVLVLLARLDTERLRLIKLCEYESNSKVKLREKIDQ